MPDVLTDQARVPGLAKAGVVWSPCNSLDIPTSQIFAFRKRSSRTAHAVKTVITPFASGAGWQALSWTTIWYSILLSDEVWIHCRLRRRLRPRIPDLADMSGRQACWVAETVTVQRLEVHVCDVIGMQKRQPAGDIERDLPANSRSSSPARTRIGLCCKRAVSRL